MSKKIDDSLREDLIALNMKKTKQTKEELDALRAQENEYRRKADDAIAAGKHYDEHGWSDTPDNEGKPMQVWQAVSKKATTLLNSDSFKAFDDYRSAMMSLVGLYSDLNAALYYSCGNFMPYMKEVFPILDGIPALIQQNITDPIGEKLTKAASKTQRKVLESVVENIPMLGFTPMAKLKQWGKELLAPI